MTRVRPMPDWPAGRVVSFTHQSDVLRGNPWNDPCNRQLNVYLPAGYDSLDQPCITLWDLAAFTNAGPGHLNWRHQGENLVQRLDRLIHQQKLPPLVVAMPDCYTSLGGNQYVNSDATGRYADYLVEELVPFLSSQLNIVDHRNGRGLFGKSSGGYGALFHAMEFPDTWGAAACHSGDMAFDLVYRPEFPSAARVLSGHGGDPRAFLRYFWRHPRPAGEDYSTLMVLAMAASYDPDPEQPGDIRLPFDLQTCALDEARWRRWLDYDPLTLVNGHMEALKSLHCLFIDAGRRDQYNLQFGTRALSAALEKASVHHHYEEHDGTHSGLDVRLDVSLPLIAAALTKACRS